MHVFAADADADWTEQLNEYISSTAGEACNVETRHCPAYDSKTVQASAELGDIHTDPAAEMSAKMRRIRLMGKRKWKQTHKTFFTKKHNNQVSTELEDTRIDAAAEMSAKMRRIRLMGERKRKHTRKTISTKKRETCCEPEHSGAGTETASNKEHHTATQNKAKTIKTITILPRQTRSMTKQGRAASKTTLTPHQESCNVEQNGALAEEKAFIKKRQLQKPVRQRWHKPKRRRPYKPMPSSAPAETEATTAEIPHHQTEDNKHGGAGEALPQVMHEASTELCPEQVEKQNKATFEADFSPDTVRYPRRSIARARYQEFMESSDEETDAKYLPFRKFNVCRSLFILGLQKLTIN